MSLSTSFQFGKTYLEFFPVYRHPFYISQPPLCSPTSISPSVFLYSSPLRQTLQAVLLNWPTNQRVSLWRAWSAGVGNGVQLNTHVRLTWAAVRNAASFSLSQRLELDIYIFNGFPGGLLWTAEPLETSSIWFYRFRNWLWGRRRGTSSRVIWEIFAGNWQLDRLEGSCLPHWRLRQVSGSRW